MAYSYQTTILSTASTGPFYFTDIDGYLSITHIKVFVNSVLQTTGYTVNESVKSVTFASAVPAGSIVKIERQTPKTVSGRFTNFEDGSVLTAQDLDNSSIQNLYIAQEAQDAGINALPSSEDGLQWDAKDRKIENLAFPIGPSDAVNKLYVDGFLLGGSAWTVPQAWTFTGDGTNMFVVEVGGVIQHPGTHYTTTALALSFVAPNNVPGNGVEIRVRNFGVARDIPAWSNPITFTDLTTTTFTATGAITVDQGISISNGPLDNTSIYIGTSGAVAGTSNTTLGVFAGDNLTTGSRNVAVGYESLKTATSSSKNTAVGYNSLGGTGAGEENVAIGVDAAKNATSVNPTQSVYVGAGTVSTASATNEIAIGYGVSGEGSNTTVIGNASTTQTKTRGNLISTGAITSTTGNISAQSGNLSASGTLTISGAGTSSIAGTLNVPTITGLTNLSATTLSGTTITGTTITAANALGSTGTLSVSGNSTFGNAVFSAPAGTAPLFMPRAWANFCSSVISTESNRTELTGTWVVESANVLVMNITNHGFAVNHVFRGVLSGGYNDTLHFTVTTVVSTNQIKVTARVPDTTNNVSFPLTNPVTGGNVAGIWKATIRSSGNVSSIVVMDNNLGRFAVNFTSPLPNANYSFIGTASNGNGTSNTGAVANATLFEANRANGAAIEFSRKTVNCLEFWCSTSNPHSANFVVFA
jgi:hypothetical protein